MLWTPTVLILDSDGTERGRIEGYLPNDEFRARLEMGLARVAFMHKRWSEAVERYQRIAEQYSTTDAAPEAIYWHGVSRYKATNDHTVLGEVPRQLSERYPESVWAKAASVWAH